MRNNRANNKTGVNSNGFSSGSGNYSSTSSSTVAFHESLDTTKFFNDRLDFILANALGKTVVVSVGTGFKYKGLLVACDTTSISTNNSTSSFSSSSLERETSNCGLNVVLQFPKVISKGENNKDLEGQQLSEILIIKSADVVDLEVKDVNLNLDQKFLENVKKLEKEQALQIEQEEKRKVEEEKKRAEEDQKTKEAMEKKATQEAEEKLKAEKKLEADAKVKAEEQAKAKQEADLKGKPEAEAKTKKVSELKAKDDENANANAESENEFKNKNKVEATIKNQDQSNIKPKKAFEKTEKPTGFKTDSAISGSKPVVKERELHRWVADTDNHPLESLESTNNGKWDQFATNKKKFNITASYDEHLYTTRINYSDPNFQNNLQKAEKLAKEIEQQGHAGNMHVAEDRGLDWDDDTVDEEDKYSGVDRRGDEILAAIQKKPAKIVKAGSVLEPKAAEETKSEAANNANVTDHVKNVGINDSSVIAASMNRTASKTNKSKKYISEIRLESSRADQIQNLKDFSQKFQLPSHLSSSGSNNGKEKENTKVSTTQNETGTSTTKTPPKRILTKPSSTSKEPNTANEGPNNKDAKNTVSKKSFFKKPLAPRQEREGITKSINFNMFLVSEKEYENEKKLHAAAAEEVAMRPFIIRKPFTAPTWEGTVDKSYSDLVSEEAKLPERQARKKASLMGSPLMPGGMGTISQPYSASGTPPMFSPAVMSPHANLVGPAGAVPMNMPVNFNGAVPSGFVPYRPPQGGLAPGPGGYVQVQPVFYPPNMMEGMPMPQFSNAPFYYNNNSGGSGAPGTRSNHSQQNHGYQNHNGGQTHYKNKGNKHYHNNNNNNSNNGHFQGSYHSNSPGYGQSGSNTAPFVPYQMAPYQAPYQQPMMPGTNTGNPGYGYSHGGNKYNNGHGRPYNSKK